MNTPTFYLEKYKVRQSFERAARNYQKNAVLQHEVESRMFSRLDYIKHGPHRILDAGCGAGLGIELLRKHYPKAEIVAMDFAYNMIKEAHRRDSLSRVFKLLLPRRSRYLCGDIERIPLRTGSCEMVWSNLVLQWINDPTQAIKEVARVLKAEGLFMFSSLGPDTFKELREVFSLVDHFTHVNRFIDMHDIGDMLANNGFVNPVMDMEIITLTYSDLKSLMQDIKAIGAHNMTSGRRHGLMGKSAWQKAVAAYEKLRQQGRLPATFEIIYGHAWKGEPRTTEDGRQIIKLVKTK